MSSRLATLARAPLLRFLAIGSALALGRATLHGTGTPEQRVIVVPREVVERLSVDGAVPQLGDGGPLDAWLDDEVLYREGLRLGLAWNPAAIARLVQVGRFVGAAPRATDAEVLADVERLGLADDDAVVRAQVAGKMRLALRQRAMRDEPDEGELQAALASHADRFVRPARASFVHVFVRRDRGGAAARAASLAGRIAREGLSRERALRLGDVFAAGHRFETRSRREIESVLGAAVAQAVMTQPEGRWSEPLESAYGWHLVRVESRTPERLPALGEMRDRVRETWRVDHASQEVPARVRELRALYRVEMPPALEPRLAAMPRQPR